MAQLRKLKNPRRFLSAGRSTGFENVKNMIADKLQSVAKELGEKAADPEGKSGIAQHGKRASEWMRTIKGPITEKAHNSFGPGKAILISLGIGAGLGYFLGASSRVSRIRKV